MSAIHTNLTFREAAEVAGVSIEDIRQAVEQKQIPLTTDYVKTQLISAADLSRWIDSQRTYAPKIQSLDQLARDQYGMSVEELFASVSKKAGGRS